MDFIAQERDRLLRSTTRVVGVTCALVSVVGIVSSLAVPLVPLLGGLACVAVLIAALLVFGTNGSVWWTALALAAGLGALALLLVGADPDVRTVVAVPSCRSPPGRCPHRSWRSGAPRSVSR